MNIYVYTYVFVCTNWFHVSSRVTSFRWVVQVFRQPMSG